MAAASGLLQEDHLINAAFLVLPYELPKLVGRSDTRRIVVMALQPLGRVQSRCVRSNLERCPACSLTMKILPQVHAAGDDVFRNQSTLCIAEELEIDLPTAYRFVVVSV